MRHIGDRPRRLWNYIGNRVHRLLEMSQATTSHGESTHNEHEPNELKPIEQATMSYLSID